jgi:hypothetical protein
MSDIVQVIQLTGVVQQTPAGFSFPAAGVVCGNAVNHEASPLVMQPRSRQSARLFVVQAPAEEGAEPLPVVLEYRARRGESSQPQTGDYFEA